MTCIKLAIFDLDGTLVDSLDELAAAANHVRNVFGLSKLSKPEVRELLGRGSRRLVENILPNPGPEDMARAQAEYLLYSKTHLLTKTCMYPGVKETLAALRRTVVHMAIISNKHSTLTHDLLTRLGIDSYFNAVLGPDTFPHRKPMPEPVLKLLADFHTDPAEGIVIGDSASDILSGKRAGVTTVACRYGYGSETELAHADYHISALPDLLKLPLFGKGTYQTTAKARKGVSCER